MRIFSGSSNFIPASTASKVLHTGHGKIHAIIATATTPDLTTGVLTLYDNTAASGTVLLVLNVGANPVIIDLDRLTPLIFTTGLTAKTTYTDVFIITEA